MFHFVWCFAVLIAAATGHATGRASDEYSIRCNELTIYPRLVRDEHAGLMSLRYRSWLLRRRKEKFAYAAITPTDTGYRAEAEFGFSGSTYAPTLVVTRDAYGRLTASIHPFNIEDGNGPPRNGIPCEEIGFALAPNCEVDLR